MASWQKMQFDRRGRHRPAGQVPPPPSRPYLDEEVQTIRTSGMNNLEFDPNTIDPRNFDDNARDYDGRDPHNDSRREMPGKRFSRDDIQYAAGDGSRGAFPDDGAEWYPDNDQQRTPPPMYDFGQQDPKRYSHPTRDNFTRLKGMGNGIRQMDDNGLGQPPRRASDPNNYSELAPITKGKWKGKQRRTDVPVINKDVRDKVQVSIISLF